MAKPGPITLSMLHHHAIVNKFLLDFEKDGSKSINLFNLFRWNLDKHFFAEEMNIFPVTDRRNKTELKEMENLMKDHRDLRGIISSMADDLEGGEKAEIAVLKELLFSHEGREVESFYPKLDERLSADEKKELVKRLRDIILG
jgi:hemerythrin superfamily protein